MALEKVGQVVLKKVNLDQSEAFSNPFAGGEPLRLQAAWR
jgi:hypothetical protein